VFAIVTDKVANGEKKIIAVVVSARNKATDDLEAMLNKAPRGWD